MAGFRDLVPVYSRLTPGQKAVLPTDFQTNTGQVDPRMLGMMGNQTPSGLVSRSVNTVPIGPDGNPIPQGRDLSGLQAALDAYAGRQASQQGGARPAVTIGTQPAGTAQMPPGVRPGSVDQAFASMGMNAPSGPNGRGRPMQTAQMNGGVFDPFGTSSLNKDESRLMPSDPRMAFNGEVPNAALGAIDQLTGSGQSTQPRSRPLSLSPRGLAGVPASPQQPSGNYTIRKGDTLSGISQKTGIPVQQLAKLNGIKNPNAIRAGVSLNLGGSAPAMTAQPTRTTQPTRQAATPTRTRTAPSKQQALAAALSDRRSQQLAEGRNTLLDEFGMIR